jgi:PAS domain S-box-containing protein
LDALGISEANWRSLATNLPEIIATLDPDGKITFINRTIGGQAPESIIGAHASALHRQHKDQLLLEQNMARVWQTGETVSYESEDVTAEGSTWYINRVGAIKQEGKVTALILISTDITEQKQTEAAMHQTQKLESLGVLAGGVAHDFNNLLTAMLMQMSFALVKLPTDHPVSHHINRTLKAAERAAELTRQMLNYTGRSPSEAKPLDLNDLITDNIHFFSAAIPKSVQLDPQLSGSIPLMMGDKGQIQQLIMNLILNAADAIGPKAGLITVETTMQEIFGDESEYWQWTGIPLTAGRYVRLDVRDTGSGMDAKTLSKIFDPFFTTKFTGRGLGLASVLGIIRSHKGGLHVTSIVDKGTTFTILFPAAGKFAQLLNGASDAPPETMGGELVLVIDDEEMVRDAMSDILSEAGLQVIKAADGPSGIQLFRKHEDELQLVLLDLSMPGMSGEEVFYKLQAVNSNVPILLISGYSEHEVMDRFVNKGLTGFIQKPYTIESLLQQIQPHLNNPRTTNMAR